MKIGDLVLPVKSDELLFSAEFIADSNFSPVGRIWNNALGIVIKIECFIPPRDYSRLQVLVDGSLGWTYSDYVLTLT